MIMISGNKFRIVPKTLRYREYVSFSWLGGYIAWISFNRARHMILAELDEDKYAQAAEGTEYGDE